MNLIMTALISSLTITILFLITEFKFKSLNEKLSPFECGFNTMNKLHRTPFSLRFFFVTMIFLIFDIEIAFVIPILSTSSFSLSSMTSQFLIILIITYGLYHEWNFGSINWV